MRTSSAAAASRLPVRSKASPPTRSRWPISASGSTDVELLVQQVINALSLGSIYALVALGVAIVFSILRLANFAHGEIMTAAGYTMYYMLDLGLSWTIVAPAYVFVSILTAVSLERLSYRPLRGSLPSTLLLTSFAVSLILQSGFLLCFGARPKPIPFPDWIDAGLTIQGVRFQWLDLATFAVTT